MKRKHDDIEILSNELANWSINCNKKLKHEHKNDKQKIEDIFNIGDLKSNKSFYNKNEVISIINKREQELHKKFTEFIKTIDTNISSEFVPKWIH
uniref:Uncharacterized protein n=1 Tax=viral metagenome TaxID=1070528 RepID=A0A6C0F7L1_9ZZZZ|tara:strand:+ start:19190 stop:19474 length:285 start_codon:yes stop_codon:yes gene_type:complete